MEPEDFLSSYESALAAQDWGYVSPLIHEDACVTFSNGQVLRGKGAIQGAFEKNFALIQDEQYAISDIRWVKKTAEFAVCLYTFHWSGLINGESASGSGRGTSVLVWERGKWFLLTEHLGPKAKTGRQRSQADHAPQVGCTTVLGDRTPLRLGSLAAQGDPGPNCGRGRLSSRLRPNHQ